MEKSVGKVLVTLSKATLGNGNSGDTSNGQLLALLSNVAKVAKMEKSVGKRLGDFF